MILSQTTIYAMRSLAVLVGLQPGVRLSSGELSKLTGVPRDYLNKVMRQLGQAGIVSAIRGNGGGFCLKRPAAKVRLAEVLRAVSMQLGLGNCAFYAGKCNLEAPCSLHDAYSRLQQQVGDWAETTTLADLGPTPNS